MPFFVACSRSGGIASIAGEGAGARREGNEKRKSDAMHIQLLTDTARRFWDCVESERWRCAQRVDCSILGSLLPLIDAGLGHAAIADMARDAV
jgi:hypothetical protein